MVNAMKRNWMTRVCALLLLLSLTVLPAGAQAATHQGLDVSVWQGEIDFAQVKAAGKTVVYIRAGYGHAEDTRFRENAAKAREAGLKTGFYFYVSRRESRPGPAAGGLFRRAPARGLLRLPPGSGL